MESTNLELYAILLRYLRFWERNKRGEIVGFYVVNEIIRMKRVGLLLLSVEEEHFDLSHYGLNCI